MYYSGLVIRLHVLNEILDLINDNVVSEIKDIIFTHVSILFKAAKILRNDCLRVKQIFTGSFLEINGEAVDLPTTLSSFLHTLLDGPC